MSASTITPDIGEQAHEEGVVKLYPGEDGIAVLRLGAPTEKMLTLTEERMLSLEGAIKDLRSDSDLRGVIVTGPGPGMFAAGADIKMFTKIESAGQAQTGATHGRTLFGMFEELAIPVVGAIEGPCLGGGLELALCFDTRVASDHKSTKIGLPEVKLGIIPGFGGTQRLSRLLGLPKALDLILMGKDLNAVRALRTGVVDRVVAPERLLDAARQEIEKLAAKGHKRRPRKLKGGAFWLSRTPMGRWMVNRTASKQLAKGQARFFPAPRRALELCLDAFRLSPSDGFANEARALGELMVSPVCKALVHLFFLTEKAKGLGKAEQARAVQRASVIGGGAMGAGIAGLMASRGIRVRLSDLDQGALARAKARLQKSLDKRLKRRRMKRHEAVAAQDRLAASTDWGHLATTDLFLEAIVENMGVKNKLFATAIERGLREDAILATNTSSLSVDEMAVAVPNPERLVGIHFFNPPEKMPLVEIIRGSSTSDAAVATACKFATALGKFPVVVKDSPGFLVNRCLGAYMNEAMVLMMGGDEPEHVDKALLNFGMPMGPARLLDQVGWDIAANVGEVMAKAFPQAPPPPTLPAAMVEAGTLGQKSGGGLYDKTGKKPGPGRAVLKRLQTDSGEPTPAEEIVARLIYPMANEAYRLLGDGIVESEDDIDLGMVFGTGFAPFTGGLASWARNEGLAKIRDKLALLAEQQAQSGGIRFEPCEELSRRADAS